MNKTLIACAVAAALGAGAAWYTTANYYQLQIANKDKGALTVEIGNTRRTLDAMAANQKTSTAALDAFFTQQKANNDAARETQNILRSLSADVAGVRSNAASLPGLIRTATAEDAREYAAACSAVFSAVVAGGQRLSEIGAGIATDADGHAADAKRARSQ